MKAKEKPLTATERRILDMWSDLGHWERVALYILLASMAWGPLTEKSNKLSFKALCKAISIPGPGR